MPVARFSSERFHAHLGDCTENTVPGAPVARREKIIAGYENARVHVHRKLERSPCPVPRVSSSWTTSEPFLLVIPVLSNRTFSRELARITFPAHRLSLVARISRRFASILALLFPVRSTGTLHQVANHLAALRLGLLFHREPLVICIAPSHALPRSPTGVVQ